MANPADTTAYRLPDGRMAVDVTEAKTLGVSDQGYVQNVKYGTVVSPAIITLPATATAGQWVIRKGGTAITSGGPAGATAATGQQVQVSPNASDSIAGIAGSEVDDKDVINTAATSRIGDEVVILNNGRTAGPSVVKQVGVWAREA